MNSLRLMEMTLVLHIVSYKPKKLNFFDLVTELEEAFRNLQMSYNSS